MSITTSIETQDDTDRFIACNNEYCSEVFKYTDWTVHTKIDGPDPRDHFANERNFLSWLRTGMTLSLIGFMTLIDIRSKLFAPSKSLPWTSEPVPFKTQIVAYIFIALGLSSMILSLGIYFKNQRKIIQRLLDVGHGWPGYSMAFMILLFVIFIMSISITE